MGRASKKGESLRVNARKFAAQQHGDTNCTQETVQLLMCLQRESFDESPGKCADQYSALADCAKAARAAAAARKGHLPNINFHLSRMSRLMRK